MAILEFDGNGKELTGYLATPSSVPAPGVIVIQEWWGLVGHIKDVCDRFAAEGFTALAPDFFDGEQTTEPDEASTLMMQLNISVAEKTLRGAISALLGHDATSGVKVGVVGFCMGGQLSLFAASLDSRIAACVDYYGIHPNVQPSLRQLEAPVLGFFGENDEFVSRESVEALQVELSALQKEHELITYPGVGHAFFNDDRPTAYNQEAAEDSWTRTLSFLRENL